MSEILLGRLHALTPWRRVFAYAAAVMVLIAATKTSTFTTQPRLAEDGHAIHSLSVAVNRRFCGVASGLSSGAQVGQILFEEPWTNEQPIRRILTDRWGSVDRYCATVTAPFVNNENSLMLLESWVWRVAPDLSLRGVGRVLLVLKIAMFAFFCVVAVRIGVGVLLCYAILDVAFALLGRLQPDFGYSMYSFLPSVVMATIALYPMLLTLTAGSRTRRIAWPIAAGAWSAFVANLRTSYLPLCAGLALLYALALLVESGDGAGRLARRFQHAGVAALCFVAAYALFQYSFIARSRGAGVEMSYHTVFHPLVLSVGVPPSAFSEREGISWNDAVGPQIAHRVDPSARYLSKEYEQALAAYYFGLWRRHPSEMLNVYVGKARLAGMELAAGEDVQAWSVVTARTLLKQVPSGIRLLALLGLFTTLAAWQFVRRGAPGLLLVTMMGAVATMLMVESIVIVPRYVLTYHAALLLLYCALTFVLIQLALDGIVWLIARAAHRPLRTSELTS